MSGNREFGTTVLKPKTKTLAADNKEDFLKQMEVVEDRDEDLADFGQGGSTANSRHSVNAEAAERPGRGMT